VPGERRASTLISLLPPTRTNFVTQFAPRPAGFQCPYAANIKSYCDAADPYCCNGNNAATHQGYGAEYGQQAIQFVLGKLGVA
jgi:acetylxylan esterase